MKSNLIATPIDEPTRQFLQRLAAHKDTPLSKLIRQWMWKGISDFAMKEPANFIKLNLDDLNLNEMAQVPKPGRPKKPATPGAAK